MSKERLEDVADLIHEDIMDLDSKNDKEIMITKFTEVEDAISTREKLEIDRKKLEIEKLKIEAEKPPEKTGWDKVIEFGKSWGSTIAAVVTVGGIVVHEIFNRKNLGDVTEFEETGSFRSTGFRKWIK